jgi:predicted secreted Zn-dependent protease
LPPHEPLNEDVKSLLLDIEGWMVDNDYKCEEAGSEIYDRINNILKKYE